MKIIRSIAARCSFVISMILLILSFTPFACHTMDIQMHDTYFVTDYAFWCRLFAVFYFVSALFYEVCYAWLTPNRGASIHNGHLIINTLCFVLISIAINAAVGTPRRYHTFAHFETFSDFNFLTNVVSISVLILFFSNLAFGLYYLYCLVRKLF